MPTTIVFMHVGPDVQMATVMARSFRRHNPRARIVQVSDVLSPQIDEVDSVVRSIPKDRNIMLFRMRCFAALETEGEAWFLDTDMLCHSALRYLGEGTPQAAVCERQFDCDGIFNHKSLGMAMLEYKGRALGDVFPYIGCATMVRDSRFWSDCLQAMEALDAKYHAWYGDQTALKSVTESGRYDVGRLPESIYACPPDRTLPGAQPIISHFKGDRKTLMLERAAEEGLI